ncbi:MAG: MFS transporter [Gammaproteobacteria bacterium]|nr:MFS transporter [Gammaproteobacteria bacterium]
MSLLDNFAIHEAAFTGREIGILQSLREIPGFLAFAVVFVLLLMREQTLAYVSLLALGVGTALTGWFPNVLGLYITTVVMSIGFHYYETVASSLALQWIDKEHAPRVLGKVLAAGSAASVFTFALVWLAFEFLDLGYAWTYMAAGGTTFVIGALCWFAFPRFPAKVQQRKQMLLRKRYWLYYALTFLSGARRQIFVVFAGFLLVQKFGFDVGTITALFLVNAVINIFLAPVIGKAIARFGERRALIFEYLGLIGVFVAYALVESGTVAAVLYVVDHLFFALAIAMRTYFQKIADPADIAATAGVSFTINHIAAVLLPAAYGLLWLVSPALVFLSGALLATMSLALSILVPHDPREGNEVWTDFTPIGVRSATTS